MRLHFSLSTILRLGRAILYVTLLSHPNWSAAIEETELKAAIVYNVLSFVEWPVDRSPSATTSLVLCLRSNSELLADLEKLASRPIRNAQLELRPLSIQSDIRLCHVLYADGSDSERAILYRRIAAGVAPVVIADATSLTSELTAIQLRRSESKFTLEINMVGLRQAGVVVSSKLLRLAKVVRE